MKVAIVFVAMVAVVVARPQEQAAPGVVPILDWKSVTDDFGQYALSYVSGDGTKVSEQGALVPNAENTGHVLIKQGTFSYFSPDGTPIEETWTADVDGFHPEGKHLPTTPAPLPAALSS